MNILRKKINERSDFEKAICGLLSGEMSGHLGPYMYTEDSSDSRWKNGHSSENYYLGKDDKNTFDLMIKDLNIKARTFIDLGPGGEESVLSKSIKISDAISAKNYVPVDMSYALANQAASVISSRRSINGHALVADFFAPLQLAPDESLIAIMGGTIGNIETYSRADNLQKRLSEIMASFRQAVASHSHFLVSFDANTNSQEVLDCYTSLQFDHLIRGCLDRAINVDAFVYEPVWTPETYQLSLGVRSRRDQIIKFSDEEFAIEEGEYLPVLNSYRYPVDFFVQTALLAGWQHKQSWTATQRTYYVLFQTA